MSETKDRNPTIQIEMFWSPDDQEYVVRLANQHGVSALGRTIKKALRSFATLLPTIVEISGLEAVATTRDDGADDREPKR
jgi:hypothetical protein